MEEDITGDTTGEAFLEEGASWKRRCSSEGTVVQGRPMPGQEQMSVHDRYFKKKKKKFQGINHLNPFIFKYA